MGYIPVSVIILCKTPIISSVPKMATTTIRRTNATRSEIARTPSTLGPLWRRLDVAVDIDNCLNFPWDAGGQMGI